MAETASKHKHWFTAIPARLGPYGPQDVHLHNCIEGEPGDCDDAIIGLGEDCGGKDAPHEHMTLTEDGMQPPEALARLRATVPVAAAPEPPPRRHLPAEAPGGSGPYQAEVVYESMLAVLDGRAGT